MNVSSGPARPARPARPNGRARSDAEPPDVTPAGADLDQPEDSTLFVSPRSLRERSDWFIKLRWAVVLGAGVVTVFSWPVVWTPLDLTPILITICVLALLNLCYYVRNHRIEAVDLRLETRLVKVQMVGDLLLLTVLLNLTGGIENPFHLIYFIHVIIASLLFKGREIYQIAALAIVLFTAEVAGEYLNLLPHHHLTYALDHHHETAYMLMTLGVFWLVLLSSAYIGASFMRHNRSIKDELVARQKEMIARDKAKTDFFRFVTHEIKNPTITTQSAIDTVLELEGESLSPNVADLLRRARNRTAQTIDMVKDLADLTRGVSRVSSAARTVELDALFRDVIDDFAEQAAERELQVEVQLPDGKVTLRTDEQAIETVFVNLFSNAIRYNSEGGRITVRIDSGRTGVSFSVRDEGIGIKLADQQKIFDEFYRTPEAKSVTTLGTGLGLPIVRRLVDQMGGRLTVASRQGEGAIFTVSGLKDI